MIFSTFQTTALLAIGLLVQTSQASVPRCSRIRECVSKRPNDYSPQYCSSYLGISVQTTSSAAATITSTSTVTETPMTTVLADSVYNTCGSGGGGNGNDKLRRAPSPTKKVHSKPFCLRDFDKPGPISAACSCLHLATSTTTITPAPTVTTVTTTTTLSSTSTVSTTAFYISFNNGYLHYFYSTTNSYVQSIFERLPVGDTFSLNGTDCTLLDQNGNTCLGNPQSGFQQASEMYCYSDPSTAPSGSQSVTCSIDVDTSNLNCDLSGYPYSNFYGSIPGHGIWLLSNSSYYPAQDRIGLYANP